VPRVSWDEVVHPVLNEKYGRALGIEPPQMLVLVLHKSTAELIEREGKEVVERTGATGLDIFRCFEGVYCRYMNPDYIRRIFAHLRGMHTTASTSKPVDDQRVSQAEK